MKNPALWIFVGPSLPASEAKALEDCRVCPPAARGDVWRALVHKPKAIALIDGVFESVPSVWHHELLAAVRSGVRVFGGASMGALRAAELHPLGMVGVGKIFEAFQSGRWVDDAEVAVLHATAEEGFRPLTVPLVNVRYAAEVAVKARILQKKQAEQWVEKVAAIFYQDRHASVVQRTLEAVVGAGKAARYQQWAQGKLLDLKAMDALETVKQAQAYARKKTELPEATAARGSSAVRRRRFQDCVQPSLPEPSGDELEAWANAGTRRLLIAAWARSQGIRPPPEHLQAVTARWASLARKQRMTPAAFAEASGLAPDALRRFLEDSALDAFAVQQSTRLIQDGPSLEEGLVFEALWNSPR